MTWSALRTCGLAVVAAIGVAAGRPAAAAETRIDVILPLTGNASFLGQGAMRVMKVVETVVNADGGINGSPLHFEFKDDQTSPQVAVQLTNAVLAQKPAVMMGSGLVAMCNAQAPLLRNGPFDYCLSPAVQPVPGSYMFSTDTSTRDLLRANVQFLKAHGWTRLAIISSSDATGQDFEKGLDAALKLPGNDDVTIVERAKFTQSDVSVAGQMERIKAANPQVLIVWTTGAAVATLFKGIVQTGLDIPVFTTNGNQTFEQMDQYAAFLPKDLYIATSLFVPHEGVLTYDSRIEAAQKTFYAAMTAAKTPIDVVAAHAWDPSMMIVGVLRKLGPGATAAAVKAAFDDLTDYAGINGIYDFKKMPQRGIGVESAVVTRWDPKVRHWTVMSQPGGAPLKS